MLLNKIVDSTPEYRNKIIATYWGDKIGCEAHPIYGYGCDLLPRGWREIAIEEFAQSMLFRYTPQATGWTRTVLGDARLFFMHDEVGIALISNSREKTIKAFKFGCKHEKSSETVGNCLTKYTCKLCGFVETIDSSD